MVRKEFEVYVIRGAGVLKEKPPGDAIRVDADAQGRGRAREGSNRAMRMSNAHGLKRYITCGRPCGSTGI